jgi:sec-independent protein translocase protein TatB
MAEGARGQLREQMGPEFDDIDWKQYDPRQYDPRRIVREALLDPSPYDSETTTTSSSASSATRDPDQPTPFDDDAT